MVNHGMIWDLPSGKLRVAIFSLAIETVDLPINNGGSFHSSVNVYQRVFDNMAGAFGNPQKQSWIKGEFPFPFAISQRCRASPCQVRWGKVKAKGEKVPPHQLPSAGPNLAECFDIVGVGVMIDVNCLQKKHLQPHVRNHFHVFQPKKSSSRNQSLPSGKLT